MGQADAMRVRVDTVTRVPLSQTVPVIGRLVAQRVGVVAARINGPIETFEVEVGDRIAQLVIVPVIQADFEVVDDFVSTDRGVGGFGHSGHK